MLQAFGLWLKSCSDSNVPCHNLETILLCYKNQGFTFDEMEMNQFRFFILTICKGSLLLDAWEQFEERYCHSGNLIPYRGGINLGQYRESFFLKNASNEA